VGSAFRALQKPDWAAVNGFLRQYPHTLSGYTLGSLVAWNDTYEYRWTFLDPETMLIAFRYAPDQRHHLLQPVGVFPAKAQAALTRLIADHPYPLKLVGCDRAFVESHTEFVSHFDVTADRDNDNYIYRASDLALLAGRRYSKKRNLLAQAAHAYGWTTEPLTPANTAECLTVLDDAALDANGSPNPNLAHDDRAIRNALRQFADLSLEGVLIKVEGRAAAFSIFEPQTQDTAVVHFERAMRSFKGLYQVINQATAKAVLDRGFTFVNREEDLGDPGLRQSKESYYPVRLAEAFVLSAKPNLLQ
jgi:hypothetical protein